MTLAFCNVAINVSAGLRFLVSGCDESLAGIAAATCCVSEQAGEDDSWAHNPWVRCIGQNSEENYSCGVAHLETCPTSRPRRHVVMGALGEVC